MSGPDKCSMNSLIINRVLSDILYRFLNISESYNFLGLWAAFLIHVLNIFIETPDVKHVNATNIKIILVIKINSLVNAK